jgi:NAD-dependent deacetylase
MRDLTPLRLDDDVRVLVLTGAGVSAESGIPTFRDSNGLWESHRVEDVASPEGFARDPVLVWRFYSLRREAAAQCSPNAGHAALAALEERLGDRFLLATQNIDGLHRVAGNHRVVEMHGNLFTTRCSACDRRPFRDDSRHPDAVPPCDRCGAMLRPHIVWFGERLDPADLARIEDFIRDARGHRMVFLAAGTSGLVYPAAGLVEVCRHAGAETVLVNLEAPANVSAFDRVIEGRSGEVLPALFG